MYLDLLRLATTNIFRARVRLVITASGVLIGTTAVMLLIGLTIGLQDLAESTLGDSIELTEIYVSAVYAPPDISEQPPQLTWQVVEQFRQLDGVGAVIIFAGLETELEVRVGRYFARVSNVLGIDYDMLPVLGVEVDPEAVAALSEDEIIVGSTLGTYFQDTNVPYSNYTTVDLLDQDVALMVYDQDYLETLRVNVVPRIMLTSERYTEFNQTVILPFEQVLELNAWVTDTPIDYDEMVFDDLTVIASSRRTTLQVVDSIEAMGFLTNSLGDRLREINNVFNLMRIVLGSIGGIALVIASFGVANTMMVAILERTSEIGLLKAVGARNRDVLLIFLLEAGLVGLVGGVCGAGFSVLVSNWFNHLLLNFEGDGEFGELFASVTSEIIVIPMSLVIFGVVLAACVGIIAGVIPALRASRIPPVVALKQE